MPLRFHIYVQDEENIYSVVLSDASGWLEFDCVYAAEQYAKSVGLKKGYIIK